MTFQNTMLTELKDGSDSIWIFYRPLVFVSKKYGTIEIPIGFETDFSSVPRVPIAYQLWGSRNHREGALHDAVFRADHPLQLSFNACNMLFLEAMESRGVSWWIRYPMYLGVCTGGIFSYRKKKMGDKL